MTTETEERDTRPLEPGPAVARPAVDSSAIPPEELEQLSNDIVAALKTVYDPEIPADIYELGLIYRIDITEEGKVEIDMTLTSPMCPVAESLPGEVEMAARGVDGVSDVVVALVWDPTWGPEVMSEAARLELGIF